MFEICFAEGVASDLAALRAYDRQIILDRIDEQLAHEPITATRMKRVIVGLKPPWRHEEPIWQLRVGEYREFYDVSIEKQQVSVRAVRHKPPHTTTEDVL
jgi:mRNA-degrading endonuclease RelE of RelBE toxin-antitoxin system